MRVRLSLSASEFECDVSASVRAPNMRMLAAMSPGRPDAGGSCRELNSTQLKCPCRQDMGGTGCKFNSQERVGPEGRCLLPTPTGELEPSYTLTEQRCWQSLYSNHIHVSAGLSLPHAFHKTSSSTSHKDARS